MAAPKPPMAFRRALLIVALSGVAILLLSIVAQLLSRNQVAEWAPNLKTGITGGLLMMLLTTVILLRHYRPDRQRMYEPVTKVIESRRNVGDKTRMRRKPPCFRSHPRDNRSSKASS